MNLKEINSATDNVLIKLIKEGNRPAFNSLFEKYWKSLFAFAFSIYREADQAEDVVQEVFFSIWERREIIEIQNPKAYLFQAVRFQVSSQIRKIKFTEEITEVVDNLSYNNVEEQINYSELNAQINKITETLPERCKEIFYMSRFAHLSNTEIAQKLDISKRTVENQITRALQKIRSAIKYTTFISIITNIVW